jgi:hypothetical protein
LSSSSKQITASLPVKSTPQILILTLWSKSLIHLHRFGFELTTKTTSSVADYLVM